MGFPTPWEHWLNGPQLEDLERLLMEPRSLQRGYFREQVLKRLLAEHRAGARDHGNRIWRLLNLELWLRVCVDGDSGAGFVAQTSAVTHE
jgi:asparagine synthase (glutamine-hydrolysing)